MAAGKMEEETLRAMNSEMVEVDEVKYAKKESGAKA
jgi:hypothetical protein